MTIGDFFSSASTARPVNPKPIVFTAVAKGTILPNGKANPHEVSVAAQVTGAFVFIGDGYTQARISARKALLEAGIDKKTGQQLYNEDDFWAEVNYQVVYRCVRQYDAKEKRAGDRLFESVEQLRDLVEASECVRIIGKYNEYVREEHPADPDTEGKVVGVDQETFRGSKE